MRIVKIGALWCPGCLVMKKIWNKINDLYELEIVDLDYENMKNSILEHASYVFSSFQTLKEVYDYRIGDLLSGNLKRFSHGGDWIFEDLYLARIVSPQSYPKVKQVILEQLEAIYNNIFTRSSDVELYYAKASEIITYLESIPVDNIPSYLIGNYL